jgi:hypothetical protein
MTPRFVHLGINPVGAVAHMQPPAAWPENFYARLEYCFTTHSIDWYRFGSQNYVLLTSIGLAELGRLISGLPAFENVYVLLTEMSNIQPPSCNGWMPQQFWQWLFKAR